MKQLCRRMLTLLLVCTVVLGLFPSMPAQASDDEDYVSARELKCYWVTDARFGRMFNHTTISDDVHASNHKHCGTTVTASNWESVVASLDSQLPALFGDNGKEWAVIICIGSGDVKNTMQAGGGTDPLTGAEYRGYCWPRTPIYEDVVVTDADGNPVWEPVYETDAEGKVVYETDAEGNQDLDHPVVTQGLKYTEDGEPVWETDAGGAYVYETDINGDIVYETDADGYAVPKKVQAYGDCYQRAVNQVKTGEENDGFQDSLSKWTATGAKVYFVSVPPVQESSTDPTNDEIRAWNSAMQSAAEAAGATWLDIFDVMSELNPEFESKTAYAPVTNATLFNVIYNSVQLFLPERPEEKSVNATLYAASAALSAFVSQTLTGNSGEDDYNDYKNKIKYANTNAGNGGDFLGYGDKDFKFVNGLMESTAHGSTKASYKALIGAEGSNSNSMYGYARYGRLLTTLGLDSTGFEQPFGSQNMLSGGVLMLLYVLNILIANVFTFLVSILSMLNPFQFLQTASSLSTSAKNALADPNGLSPTGSAQPIIDMIGSVYDACANIAWYLAVPLSILLVILGVFLLRPTPQNTMKRNRWIKLFLVRIVFAVIAVPLLGSLYTVSLAEVKNMSSDKRCAASSMVAASFVDFEAWARNARLAPFDDLVSVPTEQGGGEASDETYRGLRVYVTALNERLGSTAHINSRLSAGTDPDAWNMSGSYLYDDTSGGFIEDPEGRIECMTLLSRYLQGSSYDAADFQTDHADMMSTLHEGKMGRIPGKDDTAEDFNKGTAYEMYDETTDVKKWIDRDAAENTEIISGSRWGEIDIFSNGDLGIGTGSGLDADSTITYDGGYGGDVTKTNDVAVHGGLSTLSMYNYLTSAFEEDGITAYSPMNTLSTYQRQSHRSVNLIGYGAMHGLYYISVFAVMFVVAVIGIFYCFGIVIKNGKTSVKMLTSMPGAMMGSVKFIVTVISCVASMVVMVLGSLFLYLVISDLLMLFVSWMDTLTGQSDKIVSGLTVLSAVTLSSGQFTADLGSSLAQYELYLGVSGLALVFLGCVLLRKRRVLVGMEAAAYERYLRWLVCAEEWETNTDTEPEGERISVWQPVLDFALAVADGSMKMDEKVFRSTENTEKRIKKYLQKSGKRHIMSTWKTPYRGSGGIGADAVRVT